MSWELGKDAHESKGASPWACGQLWLLAGQERALGWTSVASHSRKSRACLGFPGEVTGTLCLSGWLLAGGLFTLKASGTSCGFVDQNCQAPEVKAQMPCQPAPGENIWGLGNGP